VASNIFTASWRRNQPVYPAIYEGTTPVEPAKTHEEGYHFTEDTTNKAIKRVRQQKALMPDKPFFMFFAPGACHAPHQVPKEWLAKYKGKFDQGWDKLREEIFAHQKELGVIPSNAELTSVRRGPRLGQDARGAEADPLPPNGDLCGVP
jgi:arylsulfatase A-like enzyme